MWAMVLEIIFIIVVLAAVLTALGLTRINLSHQSSVEGIEDPQAAQAYNRISRWPQFRLLRRLIVAKLAKYGPSGTLADIGCGPGLLSTLIASRFPNLHVLGIDISDEMIREAALNASSLGLSNRVEFHKGDVNNLPVPDGALDFAVSTLSLHHWSDPVHGLNEIHRVLKNDGQLLLFDLRRDPRRFFYWLIRFAQAFVVPSGLRRINEPLGSLRASYTPPELEGLFKQSRFKVWKIGGGAGWVLVWASKCGP